MYTVLAYGARLPYNRGMSRNSIKTALLLEEQVAKKAFLDEIVEILSHRDPHYWHAHAAKIIMRGAEMSAAMVCLDSTGIHPEDRAEREMAARRLIEHKLMSFEKLLEKCKVQIRQAVVKYAARYEELKKNEEA